MTLQKAFNRIWRHFVTKKGPRSYNGRKNGCMYRGPDGAKCAIGLLIPERLYKPEMEGDNVLADEVWEAARKAVPGVRRRTLKSLQECHDRAADNVDNASFGADIERRLTSFASRRRLKIPV
jgi:hypothetical protein